MAHTIDCVCGKMLNHGLNQRDWLKGVCVYWVNQKFKSEKNNPWFKPWFNILLHTQSIVCATVDSQCLEYLGYIPLAKTPKRVAKNRKLTIFITVMLSAQLK